jgi:uncharacterized protein
MGNGGHLRKKGCEIKMLLDFTVIDGIYGVCSLDKKEHIPDWAYESEFYTITKTPDELSIVCSQESIPSDTKCEKDWRILKVEGKLDFSLTGILASISNTLAKVKISIFTVSTYDTDYIFLKNNDFKEAISALKQVGYGVNTVEE